jgi:DNA-binding beta-propeller fold protein YncE
MLKRSAMFLTATLATLVSLVPAAPAAAATITEFPIGTLNTTQTRPAWIASSPTGRLWFVDLGTVYSVRQMNTAGELTGSAISTPAGAGPPTSDLAFAADGALAWTANEDNLSPSRPFINVREPNGTFVNEGPYEGIRDGSALAFVGTTLYTAFRDLNEKGQAAGFSVCFGLKGDIDDCFGEDVLDGRLTDLTVDGGGRLWAMQPDGDVIRRTNAARTAFDLAIPAPGGSRPGRAALGPDGNLWVAAFGDSSDAKNTKNQILRVTPAGTVTSFPLPTGRGPKDIVAGPDGALWFTELVSGSIGRITTCGEYKSFPLPTPDAKPFGIVLGADGALWFGESNAAKIGRLMPDPPSGDCQAPAPIAPPAPKTPAADTTAPTLGPLLLSPAGFRAAGSGASASAKGKAKAPIGTKVSFSLSEAANVSFGVERKGPGRLTGGGCVQPKPANAGRRPCPRWTKVSGSFSVAGQAGANTFSFRGVLNGRALRPGAYRLNARATDPAGNSSAAQSRGFTILP